MEWKWRKLEFGEVFIVVNYVANSGAAAAAALTTGPKARDTNTRLQSLLPAATNSDYCGRVSTFYSTARATYCETYEPPRATVAGDVWRLESRFVGGRWLHMAYSIKGVQLNIANGKFGMYENAELPLLFDPDTERDVARRILDAHAGAEKVKLGGQNLVYGSPNDGSVGIVRVIKG